MIRKITLRNWKSFREATLYFDPLVVLIGTNASGKSNVIDALDFLSRIAQSKDLAECLHGSGNGETFRGGVEWVTRRGEQEFSLEVVVGAEGDPGTDYRYEITVRPAPRPIVTAESLSRIKRKKHGRGETSIRLYWTDACSEDEPAIQTRLYNGKAGTLRSMQRGLPLLTQFQIASTSIKAADINLGIRTVWQALGRLFILNPIPSHMRSFSPKAQRMNQDASNLAGVIATLPEGEKAMVEQTILGYVRDLPEKDIQSLHAELTGPFKDFAVLICKEGWHSGGKPVAVDSRAMSDGTLRFIAITAALLTLPEQTQLIIEEVDNGLHPSRSDLLLKMIREVGQRRHVDVLCSTHNPALLDALGPEMTPFVVVAHRDDGGDSKLTLLEDVNHLPKLLSSGRLGALATSGELEESLKQGELGLQ
ncbi:MAG: AAA family ATPase [Verrucomicrobiota bacterium]|jgi:predicted ATPase